MTVTETIQVLSRRRIRGGNTKAIVAGPAAAVRGMKLHYVTDRTPGIERETSERGFAYRSSNGRVVRGIGALARIRALAIPPAWTRVWICADPDGHLQAVGRDARGRKQYRYHPRWREHRDETKFEHILAFGAVLPRIRRQVAQHLSLPGLPREKVLAAVVRLMELSLARVGNPEYAKQNHSFGLTTLLNRHVRIRGGQIELDFRAKHGIRHHSIVTDRKLAGILKRCRDLPGSELFQYLAEDGNRHAIDSSDLNGYLREMSGRDVTAKDFRTWAGTNLAILALIAASNGAGGPTKHAWLEVVRQVAKHLGNTPAICRRCYIHPRIEEAYLASELVPQIPPRFAIHEDTNADLAAIEHFTLSFLGQSRA
jgi:DNA topoisomerase I